MKTLLCWLLLITCSCFYSGGKTQISIPSYDIELIDDFFNHKIEMEKVEVYEVGDLHRYEVIGRTVGNHIYLASRIDYVDNSDNYIFLLIHEFSHIFQNQIGVYSGGDDSVYEYYIFSSSGIESYGKEAQAQMMSDLYLILYEDNYTLTMCKNCDMLTKVEITEQLSRLHDEFVGE